MRTAVDLKLRLLHDGDVAMGPGKADLLDAIARTGSISAAARDMDMSYRRAWLLVDVMNGCFAQPVVARAVGGSHGGGARLTETGTLVLAEYRKMEAAAQAAVEAQGAALARLLKSPE